MSGCEASACQLRGAKPQPLSVFEVETCLCGDIDLIEAVVGCVARHQIETHALGKVHFYAKTHAVIGESVCPSPGELGRLVGLACLALVLARLGRVLEAGASPDWRVVGVAAMVVGGLVTTAADAYHIWWEPDLAEHGRRAGDRAGPQPSA